MICNVVLCFAAYSSINPLIFKFFFLLFLTDKSTSMKDGGRSITSIELLGYFVVSDRSKYQPQAPTEPFQINRLISENYW